MEEPKQLKLVTLQDCGGENMSFDVNLPKRHTYSDYTHGDITPLCLCKWTKLRRLRREWVRGKVTGHEVEAANPSHVLKTVSPQVCTCV